jgi:hypothetical protein
MIYLYNEYSGPRLQPVLLYTSLFNAFAPILNYTHKLDCFHPLTLIVTLTTPRP